MLYPYKSQTRPQGYQDNLYSIAQGDRKPAYWTTFCQSVASHSADDFDDVTEDLCQIRHANLHSADAFHAATSGDIYFIEFKDDDQVGLNAIGHGQPKIDPHTGQERKELPIDITLLQKAFDSLAVAALTACHDMTTDDLKSRAVFVVVRRDDPPSYTATVNTIASWAKTTPSPSPVLWGLDRLCREGYYKQVFTWTETEFSAQVAGLLK